MRFQCALQRFQEGAYAIGLGAGEAPRGNANIEGETQPGDFSTDNEFVPTEGHPQAHEKHHDQGRLEQTEALCEQESPVIHVDVACVPDPH